MELDKAIRERRSTRKFDTKKIDKSDINKLIESARWAPSAGNRQNWFFVVLEGDTKLEVASIMEEQIKNSVVTMDGRINATHAYNPTSSVIGSIKVIKEAPVFLLVFRKRSADWLEGDYLSIGCAVEHISLKAVDLGFSSLWVRDVVYTRDKIAKYVGYEDLELVTGIALGHSIEFPYKRCKKSLEEIMICK